MEENKEKKKEKLLNLLGLCQKASYLVSGEDNVIKEMRKGKLKIVFIASDSSLRTIDNFQKKCYFYNVETYGGLSFDEISSSIGRSRKIVGLKDAKMYEKVKQYLEVNE